MGRPLAEPRQVLERALASMPEGATWRTMAERTGLPPTLTRETLKNMARAGRVVKGEPVRLPGVNRPATVFKIESAGQRCAGHDLSMAMRAWA